MDTAILMPLVTLVFGALLSYLASWFSERTKWQREFSTRWDNQCLAALTEFATSLKVETRLCLRMASWLELGPETEPLNPAVGLPRLEDAEDTRAEKFEAIRLLSDEATVAAAQQWQYQVWQLHRFVTQTEDARASSFQAEYKATGIARDAFYSAARLNLGVKSATGSEYEPLEHEDSNPRF